MRWTKMYGTEDGNDGNVLVEIKSKESSKNKSRTPVRPLASVLCLTCVRFFLFSGVGDREDCLMCLVY